MARRTQVEHLLHEIGILQREIAVLTKERDMALEAKRLTDEFAEWAGINTPEKLRQWAVWHVAQEEAERASQ